MKRKTEDRLLTEDKLKSLTTPRLLSYLKSLHAYHESEHQDTYGFPDSKFGEIVKCSNIWKEHRALVKSILAEREHIEQ